MRQILLPLSVAGALLAGMTPSFSTDGPLGDGRGAGVAYGPPKTGSGNGTYKDYREARHLMQHEKYIEAIGLLEGVLADKPNDTDALKSLGFSHRMLGERLTDRPAADEYVIALTYYRKAQTIEPGDRETHEFMGELYLKIRDQTSAASEMQTLATLCPTGCDERDALSKAMAAYVPPK